MAAERDDGIRLDDMKTACRKILRYMAGVGQVAFMDDDMRVDAVLRNIGIIGEATTKLTTEFQEEHPVIPWVAISGMRHRLIHDYGHVDLEVVWNTIQHDIPKLLAQLEAIPDDASA